MLSLYSISFLELCDKVARLGSSTTESGHVGRDGRWSTGVERRRRRMRDGRLRQTVVEMS